MEMRDSKSKSKEWKGELSGVIVPRFCYLQKTVHSAKDLDILAMLKQKMSDSTAPDSVIEAMAAKMAAKLGQKSGESRIEWHIMLLAEDTKNDVVLLLANCGRTDGDGMKWEKPDIVDDEENASTDLDRMVASSMATALHMSYGKDWHGERTVRLFVEDIESVASMRERVLAEGGIEAANALDGLMPCAIEPESMPILELSPEDKSKRHAELVKRFGAKAIADLEKRIEAKKRA